MSQPLRVGLIGLGAIAPYFIEAVAANYDTKLVAVCDRSPAKLGLYESDGYQRYEQMLRDAELDLAIVTLPNNLHEEVVSACLDAGVNVCCEKPLVFQAAAAQRLAANAAERDLVLAVASHRRFNKRLTDLASLLDGSGSAVRHLVVRYYEDIREHSGSDSWYSDLTRSGGGCVVDNGPNAFDMARVLVGEIEVTGSRLSQVHRGMEFRAQMDALARSGTSVTFDLRWDYPGQLKDVTAFTEDGKIARADLLLGWDGLKGSLAHEYEAIVANLVANLRARTPADDVTVLVSLVEKAYDFARIP